MFTDQSAFEVRFEWGERGLEALGTYSEIIIVVDVLSFSTSVDVATARGATILPFPWDRERAALFAHEQNALLALQHRSETNGFSLSPTSLNKIPLGTRLVLPSPNGAALCCRAAQFSTVVAGCLRNAEAVATYAQSRSKHITVIACGERWPDGSLRVAWEDLIGAGAIIAHLKGKKSPEAAAAFNAFSHSVGDLPRLLKECASGRELIERGYASDLDFAAALNVSVCVPRLEGHVFSPCKP